MQHLDEGTIHAWLDGQLPREEALAVEAHVAECRECADAVAEARGLIAASSRILTALDSVPGEVVPKQPSFRAEIEAARAEAVADAAADALVPLELVARRPRRRWFNGASLAAAAAIVVAVGTVTVMQRSGRDLASLASKQVSPAAATSGSSSDSIAPVAAIRTPPAAPAAAPPAAKSLGDERSVAAERQVGGAMAGAKAERVVANEAARRAATDSAIQPVTVLKETESRALYGAAANSPRIAIRSVPQRADTTANKPVDQLAKDKKQEVQVAQQAQTAVAGNQRVQVDVPRREPFGATIAKPDTARAERPQQVAADATAKGVATGGVKGRVTDGNNIGLSDVTVSVAGTNTGVVTNAAGEFTIGGLQGGGYQLNVRRIGYQQVDRDVTVVPGQTSQMDVVLSATQLSLNNVVVTGAAGAAPRDAGARAKTAAAPAPVIAAAQTNAVGCYELGITAFSATRNAFREVPRRVALDSVSMPARADGVWYRARDLARTNTLPNGLWRPTGPDGVELEWVYGSRTSRINVSGPAGSIMRGTLQEIDRAKASGEAANVVAIRRACEP
jgi:hypothetical protein